MRWPRFELRRRWLAPAALLLLVPKCALCVLAYTGLGALLGLGGPELCRADGGSPAPWQWFAGGLAVALLLALGLRSLRRRHARS